MKKITAIALIAALSTTLSACGKAGGTPSKPVATVTVTAAPEAAPSQVDDSTTMNVLLTKKAVWRNGVTARIDHFRRGKSTPESSPANTSYLKFTITLHNGSGVTLDTGGTRVECPGGDGEIFDGDRLGGSPAGHLLPGKSVSWVTACGLAPDATFAQIEVTPQDDLPNGYRTAIFTGVVR